MTRVKALDIGYFGGIVRAVGDVFEVPDELWADKKRRPSWAEAVKFGGKGDHDDDGNVGGAKPVDEEEQRPKRRGRPRAETVDAPTAEPFTDAPEPGEARGNGIKDALGIEPDWVAPKPID